MRAKILLLAMSLSLSGCFSTLGHLSGERCVYHGTRLSWVYANHPSLSNNWPLLIDTPFSAVLDTVLLPYDLTAFLPEGMGGDREACEIRPLRVM
ncbi:YceK/YidQ family lipoprotein [Pseudomonas phoenicis]|uniref:YceK/YidQ family lipoprotein n=1 Tax=unclassified Pseudomonas TaxID=196821 RepID=UPI0039A2570E